MKRLAARSLAVASIAGMAVGVGGGVAGATTVNCVPSGFSNPALANGRVAGGGGMSCDSTSITVTATAVMQYRMSGPNGSETWTNGGTSIVTGHGSARAIASTACRSGLHDYRAAVTYKLNNVALPITGYTYVRQFSCK